MTRRKYVTEQNRDRERERERERKREAEKERAEYLAPFLREWFDWI